MDQPSTDANSTRASDALTHLLAVLALGFSSALWGSSFLLGKLAMADMTAGQVIVLRFAIASVILLPMTRPFWRRWQWKDLPQFVLSGLLMVPVMMLLQFEGLRRTSATHAALIIGTVPVLMAVAATIFDRERVGPLVWVAAVVSSGGVGLMMLGAAGPEQVHDLFGDVLVLASALAAVAWIFVTRRLLLRYPSVGVTALSIAMGTLLLLPITLIVDGTPAAMPDRGALLALLGLGVGCTALTYGLWNWGLRHLPASRAGLLVNLEPLVGAILGIALLAEPLGLGVLIGGGCILASAVIAAIFSREAAVESGADAGALPDEVIEPA